MAGRKGMTRAPKVDWDSLDWENKTNMELAFKHDLSPEYVRLMRAKLGKPKAKGRGKSWAMWSKAA